MYDFFWLVVVWFVVYFRISLLMVCVVGLVVWIWLVLWVVFSVRFVVYGVFVVIINVFCDGCGLV